jgi:hypothetical protein
MVSRLYTHNLQIQLVDDDDNPIECPIILREIKRRLHRIKYTHVLDINGHALACTITWKWCELTKRNTLFIGDLFSCPIYRHDSIVYSHTNATLRKIEQELKRCNFDFIYPRDSWSIAFFITKVLDNGTVPLSVIYGKDRDSQN